MTAAIPGRELLALADEVKRECSFLIASNERGDLFKRVEQALRLAAKPADEGVCVWLREVDSGTDNACWVVCNRVDPDAVEFSSTTGEPKR